MKLVLIIGLVVLVACQNEELRSNLIVAQEKDSLEVISDSSEAYMKDGHIAFNEVVENVPNRIQEFVPSGFKILRLEKGDLNLDSIQDVILVLKEDNEEYTSDVIEHPTKRPLLILIGKGNKEYDLIARNDNVVLCIDCGGMMGDPFVDVDIDSGYFTVHHYGGSAWRWAKNLTFSFEELKNEWLLTEIEKEYFNAGNPEETREIKIEKPSDFGTISFAQYNVYEE